MSTQEKPFDLQHALREIFKQNAAILQVVSELNAAKPAAPAAAGASATTRTLREPKVITSKAGKPMVFLNIRHNGQFIDLIVSGKHADAAAELGEGSRIEYEVEKVEAKPAVDRDGAPVLSKKTGEQIINRSAFASHFRVVEAVPMESAEPAPRQPAPKREVPPADIGDDDVPF